MPRTAARVLLSPKEGMAMALERRSTALPLLVATVCSLALTVAVAPRVDWSSGVRTQLEEAGVASRMTPHELEEAAQKAATLAVVAEYLGSALGSLFAAAAIAAVLWAASRVVGGSPSLRACFAVAAWSRLPIALGHALAIPAALHGSALRPVDLSRLLPSNAAFFLPAERWGAPLELAASVDLFSLWALALVVLGVAQVGGFPRARALGLVATLWLAYVAVFRLAPLGLLGAAS